jgi:hypothetical protein
MTGLSTLPDAASTRNVQKCTYRPTPGRPRATRSAMRCSFRDERSAMTRCSQPILRVVRPPWSFIAAAAIASGLPGTALGPSSKKYTGSAPRGSGGGRKASGSRQVSPELATGGYRPVCIIENTPWVKVRRLGSAREKTRGLPAICAKHPAVEVFEKES